VAPALPVTPLGRAPTTAARLSAALSDVTATAPPRADDAPAYVGRETELAQILGAAEEAAVGRPRVVLVTGDAGAGKTALADWVSRHLAGEGWTVATGRCPERAAAGGVGRPALGGQRDAGHLCLCRGGAHREQDRLAGHVPARTQRLGTMKKGQITIKQLSKPTN
jgi:hypothetical protein